MHSSSIVDLQPHERGEMGVQDMIPMQLVDASRAIGQEQMHYHYGVELEGSGSRDPGVKGKHL
jgi:hypothetical protein